MQPSTFYRSSLPSCRPASSSSSRECSNSPRTHPPLRIQRPWSRPSAGPGGRVSLRTPASEPAPASPHLHRFQNPPKLRKGACHWRRARICLVHGRRRRRASSGCVYERRGGGWVGRQSRQSRLPSTRRATQQGRSPVRLMTHMLAKNTQVSARSQALPPRAPPAAGHACAHRALQPLNLHGSTCNFMCALYGENMMRSRARNAGIAQTRPLESGRAAKALHQRRQAAARRPHHRN